MNCLAVTHLAFEDLGSFGSVLQDYGYTVRTRHAGIEPLTRAEWTGADLVVVLGGPLGATDTDDFPWLLALAASPAHAHDHSFGTHGMVLFGGREALYASHLPLFRAPHDHQVVLRVRLSDPALDRALRERLDGKTALWTIEPERFELSRLGPASSAPLTAFDGGVYEGHFERGGVLTQAKAGFVVEQVLVYRRLDPAVRASTQARYLPVGRFLVKEIDSRPDFDHIVAMKAARADVVTIPKAGVANPEELLKQIAPVAGTVYFETEDLR